MLDLTFCYDEDLEVSGEAVRLEDASAVVENLVTGPAGIRPVVPEMHGCEEELIPLVVASLLPVCNPRQRYTRSSAGDGAWVSFSCNVERVQIEVPLEGFCVSVCVCVCVCVCMCGDTQANSCLPTCARYCTGVTSDAVGESPLLPRTKNR